MNDVNNMATDENIDEKGLTLEYFEKQVKWAKNNLATQHKHVKHAEEYLETWERMLKRKQDQMEQGDN